MFFPLVFLAPAFAPLEFLVDWLGAVGRFNPVTYVVQGMRSLTVEGFVWSDIAIGTATIVGIGVVTLTAASLALRARARS